MTEALFLADLNHPQVGGEFTLGGDEGRHAAAVRRVRPGETIVVADGAGTAIKGEVTASDKTSVTLRIDEVLQIVLRRDIRGDSDRGAVAEPRIDLGRGGVAGVLLAARDHDLCALLGHRLGDRPADAARRSGDQRDLTAHVEKAHAPAFRAKSHAFSARGRTRSDIALAWAEEAVPSMTRFLIPCMIPARRKKL